MTRPGMFRSYADLLDFIARMVTIAGCALLAFWSVTQVAFVIAGLIQ